MCADSRGDRDNSVSLYTYIITEGQEPSISPQQLAGGADVTYRLQIPQAPPLLFRVSQNDPCKFTMPFLKSLLMASLF